MPRENQPNESSELLVPLPDRASSGSATTLSPTPEVHTDEDAEAETRLPFPVVAIGASSGGVEAYVDLFRSLAVDTGMAFVVLPHLSGEHESQLAQILSGVTRMPVQEIRTGSRPEPNTVHVLSAKMRATLRGGVFQMEPRPPSERIPMPIDHFFRSLAADQKNRSIGVVLSGSNSDGALGLVAIKGEGGIAIVQEPESAHVEDMPRAAILADHVDLILAPAEIASELSRLAHQFFQPSLQLLQAGDLAPTDEPHFARLLMLLRNVTGIEFRHYKPATLRRRTARRMILTRVESLAQYVRVLQESREELRNLHEDVLINVTRFFRDPSVFDVLKSDILPTLFDNRPPDQQVRIWIAACSTGEEAYSVAMCLLEYLGGQPHEPPIQIFGTDASERSIEKARMALYPESIAKDISPERLRRFFVKTDKGYQISKRVRDLCIFARQNICNDPPFSRLDLISCRNLLIYLDRAIQGQVIATFHYALRASGCLLLGYSESVTDTAGLFTPVDRKNKFYIKLGEANVQALRAFPRPVVPDTPPHTPAALVPSRGVRLEAELQRAADRAVIARHAPPGVVINDAMDVLEVRGRTAPFLSIAPGAASLHLLRMAHGDIMPMLRSAVRRAIDSGGPVLEDIAIHQGPEPIAATLEVLPVQVGSSHIRHYLVLFVPISGRTFRSEHRGASISHPCRPAVRIRAARWRPSSVISQPHAHTFNRSSRNAMFAIRNLRQPTKRISRVTRNCRVRMKNWKLPRRNSRARMKSCRP